MTEENAQYGNGTPPPQEEPTTEMIEKKAEFLTIPTDDIDTKLANVDKAFELVGKLRKFALKHLSANSVTNENGKPYIMENGVNVFDAPFAIYEKDVEGFVVKEGGQQVSLSDPSAFKGEIISIIYKGIVGSKTLGIEFSFEGGVYMTEKEKKFHAKEDFLFFSKKAKANWRGRARRKLLGLDNVDWTELADYGITPDKCASVTRKQGGATQQTAQESADENATRGKIGALLSEIYPDNAEDRSNQLELLTAFEGKDGSMVSGVRNPKDLRGKRLTVVYGKVKKWVEELKDAWENVSIRTSK